MSLKRYKKRMIKKYGNLCWYCLEEFNLEELTIDHIIPEAIGGESSLHNYALACIDCNESKDTMQLKDFCEVLAFENRIKAIQEEDMDYDKIEQVIRVYIKEIQEQDKLILTNKKPIRKSPRKPTRKQPRG